MGSKVIMGNKSEKLLMSLKCPHGLEIDSCSYSVFFPTLYLMVSVYVCFCIRTTLILL